MNNKSYGYVVVTVLIVGIIVFFIVRGNNKEENIEAIKSGVEKNYGVSYQVGEVNVNKDGTIDSSGINVTDIVPDKETLIGNLKDQGFEVEITDAVFTSDIKAEQIYASKGEVFCSITYGLNETDAEAVFLLYEKKYPEEDYYIMAKNETFVYCISDYDTFIKSGFKGLTNSGTQYINHENY